MINEKDYEDMMQRVREYYKEHPELFFKEYNSNFGSWEPDNTDCLHMTCPSCKGTGRKEDGSWCVHHISCPCPRCSFTC